MIEVAPSILAIVYVVSLRAVCQRMMDLRVGFLTFLCTTLLTRPKGEDGKEEWGGLEMFD